MRMRGAKLTLRRREKVVAARHDGFPVVHRHPRRLLWADHTVWGAVGFSGATVTRMETLPLGALSPKFIPLCDFKKNGCSHTTTMLPSALCAP